MWKGRTGRRRLGKARGRVLRVCFAWLHRAGQGGRHLSKGACTAPAFNGIQPACPSTSAGCRLGSRCTRWATPTATAAPPARCRRGWSAGWTGPSPRRWGRASTASYRWGRRGAGGGGGGSGRWAGRVGSYLRAGAGVRMGFRAWHAPAGGAAAYPSCMPVVLCNPMHRSVHEAASAARVRRARGAQWHLL